MMILHSYDIDISHNPIQGYVGEDERLSFEVFSPLWVTRLYKVSVEVRLRLRGRVLYRKKLRSLEA